MALTSASTCSYEGGGEEGIPDCSISCVDSVRRELEFILSMSLTFAENIRNVTSLNRFNLLQSLYRIYLNHWSYLTFLISWPEIRWKCTSLIKSITDEVIFKEKQHITAWPYSLYHEKHLGRMNDHSFLLSHTYYSSLQRNYNDHTKRIFVDIIILGSSKPYKKKAVQCLYYRSQL